MWHFTGLTQCYYSFFASIRQWADQQSWNEKLLVGIVDVVLMKTVYAWQVEVINVRRGTAKTSIGWLGLPSDGFKKSGSGTAPVESSDLSKGHRVAFHRA